MWKKTKSKSSTVGFNERLKHWIYIPDRDEEESSHWISSSVWWTTLGNQHSIALLIWKNKIKKELQHICSHINHFRNSAVNILQSYNLAILCCNCSCVCKYCSNPIKQILGVMRVESFNISGCRFFSWLLLIVKTIGYLYDLTIFLSPFLHFYSTEKQNQARAAISWWS